MKSRRTILVAFAAVSLIAAAWAWVSYVGQGIAYGDVFGVKGRETDLAVLGRGACVLSGLQHLARRWVSDL